MRLLLENLSCHLGVEIEYSEIPPVELNAEWTQLFDLSIPQFAAKERKCKQGNFPCGGRCISGKAKRKDGSPVQCRKTLPGQAKTFAEFMKKQKGNSEPPSTVKSKTSSNKAKTPDSSAVSVNESKLKSIRAQTSEKFGEKELKQAEQKVQKALDESSIYVRTSADAMESILSQGYKNTYQRNPEVKEFSYEYFRQQDEKDMFGLKDDAKPDDYPVYGYFAGNPTQNGKARVDHYGDVAIKLKSNVKSRTTATMGDSLSGIYPSSSGSFDAASMMTKDERDGGYDDFTRKKIAGLGQAKSMDDVYSAMEQPYFEAQIKGGFSIDDIEELSIPKGQKLPDSVLKLAKEKGIKVVER